MLAAALNQQAMLWKTSPASTELEETTLGWLRHLVGLPEGFDGVIYDTASISTLHGLAAARERAVPEVRMHGLAGAGRAAPRLRLRARALVDRQGGDDARPRPRRAAPDPGRRRVPDATRRPGRGHRRRPGARRAPGGRGGDDRHDVHDQRRSRRGDRGHLRDARRVAARGRGVRRRRGDACPSCAPHFAGLGAGRFHRRQPAQVAVHADGHQRALLPPHAGAAARRFRWCRSS